MQRSGLVAFHVALNRLDAAMNAAGESRTTVGGSHHQMSVPDVAPGGGRVTSRGEETPVVGGNPRGSGWDQGTNSSGEIPGVGLGMGPTALMATAAVAQQSSRLIFEMFYLTDELLYYALKHEGYVGEPALRLANLVYSVVFRHEVRRP